jgi:ribosomal protein L7/L12
LSIGYDSDGDGSCLKLAEVIRQFIGLPAQDDLMAGVLVAVNQGNVIEAVRLLREGRQLSLTQAKQMVDSLRESAADGKEKV